MKKPLWMRGLRVGLASVVALGGVTLCFEQSAQAQEIQLTGPLAGAPAVRKLRLHRQGRFELTPNASFTLLDEYQRTIIPGLRAMYHITDWFGVAAWGGYGLQYTTGLSDQLQEKAIDQRNCDGNPAKDECALTAVNLTKGNLADDQLAKQQWFTAVEAHFTPFRGKLALFSVAFVDVDVNLFAGFALAGTQERQECEANCASPANFVLVASDPKPAPTFGLGLNFYPTEIFGFGGEFRALPYSWNPSGFDVAGGGPDGEFPDNKVNGDDSSFRFNSMIVVNFIFRFPEIELSE